MKAYCLSYLQEANCFCLASWKALEENAFPRQSLHAGTREVLICSGKETTSGCANSNPFICFLPRSNRRVGWGCDRNTTPASFKSLTHAVTNVCNLSRIIILLFSDRGSSDGFYFAYPTISPHSTGQRTIMGILPAAQYGYSQYLF